ncbi:PBPRA1643 family SWIM/SEC-C metal-binding motif protein [Oceanicoccus sagamiensis]|uniref:Zinc chelation protein SecC n=1 Tax=Oceanicoccus sagamiensis TaxID=716816 RepID=A0A1X9NBM9_9GAMM|nr:PBPRA1643 family SWIM/SEC-C metal-binding motif protein [Oceanicoccus sagamiensis]ARN73315.1 zinc chelation protein SecC [Oceanicoccus sagamiensis]
MSDKFFFKGRQDARQDHHNHGYQTKAGHKPGSKKYPMTLVVTSEARKQEVELLVDQAQLYADIRVDDAEDAVESIEELTMALAKGNAVKVEQMPERNQPCHCGSGKKFKKCCG